MYSTDGNPPHGVGPAGFFRLQNPGLTVNLVQDVPELGQGLQNQQKVAVNLVQSSLTNKTTTNTAETLLLKTTSSLLNKTVQTENVSLFDCKLAAVQLSVFDSF